MNFEDYNEPVQKQLKDECKLMLDYALKKGVVLENNQLALLDEESPEINKLLEIYNYLVEAIKPMKPETILLFRRNQRKGFLGILGPLPIVRQFMVVTIFSILVCIVTSLSSHVNVHSIQLSMLQGSGMNQILRLIFLLSFASIGGAFYALFKMNDTLSKQTFDPSLSYTYWTRFVLGLVSGLLLSEMFAGLIEPQQLAGHVDGSDDDLLNSFSFLMKPILAIIGGFSADLVYRILNKLVSSIETTFKGDVEDVAAQKEEQTRIEAKGKSDKQKMQTAQQLMQLKQTLLTSNATPEAIEHLDSVLGATIGKNIISQLSDDKKKE